MSLGGGGGGSRQNNAADEAAAMSRAQYDDYNNRFVPIENEILGSIGDTEQQARDAAAAGVRSDQAFDVSSGVLGRNLGRLQVTPTAEVKQASDRKISLGRAIANVDAQNRTKMSAEDRDLSLAGGMIPVGRSLSMASQGNLQNVAQLEGARNNANSAADASDRAGKMQLAATVGMAAIIF